MKVNYHTHLGRCLHAVGTEREYVESAIEAGFDVLGISDHVAWPFPNGYVSRVRMPMREMDSYVQTVLDLKKEYKNDIKLLLGFETEYMPAMFRELMQTVDQYPLDYMILGQHYFDAEGVGAYVGDPFSDTEALHLYVHQTLEGLDTGRFLYLAHPDLPNFRGDAEDYRAEMEYLCREVKKRDIPIEFNLLGFGEQRWYPRAAFWDIVKDVGNRVIFGYDAHQPSFLARSYLRDRAAEYLRSLGIVPLETLGVENNL